jgi:hypothetical protein
LHGVVARLAENAPSGIRRIPPPPCSAPPPGPCGIPYFALPPPPRTVPAGLNQTIRCRLVRAAIGCPTAGRLATDLAHQLRPAAVGAAHRASQRAPVGRIGFAPICGLCVFNCFPAGPASTAGASRSMEDLEPQITPADASPNPCPDSGVQRQRRRSQAARPAKSRRSPGPKHGRPPRGGTDPIPAARAQWRGSRSGASVSWTES